LKLPIWYETWQEESQAKEARLREIAGAVAKREKDVAQDEEKLAGEAYYTAYCVLAS
jgi:hypothetical protein